MVFSSRKSFKLVFSLVGITVGFDAQNQIQGVASFQLKRLNSREGDKIKFDFLQNKVNDNDSDGDEDDVSNDVGDSNGEQDNDGESPGEDNQNPNTHNDSDIHGAEEDADEVHYGLDWESFGIKENEFTFDHSTAPSHNDNNDSIFESRLSTEPVLERGTADNHTGSNFPALGLVSAFGNSSEMDALNSNLMNAVTAMIRLQDSQMDSALQRLQAMSLPIDNSDLFSESDRAQLSGSEDINISPWRYSNVVPMSTFFSVYAGQNVDLDHGASATVPSQPGHAAIENGTVSATQEGAGNGGLLTLTNGVGNGVVTNLANQVSEYVPSSVLTVDELKFHGDYICSGHADLRLSSFMYYNSIALASLICRFREVGSQNGAQFLQSSDGVVIHEVHPESEEIESDLEGQTQSPSLHSDQE